ncbi:MAG: hypothetical protein IK063_00230, partial [Clostridia bacterium]|nr:hypothetical protein [Clostridia bacterium]
MDRDNMNFDLDALLEEAKSYSSGTPAPASADVSSAPAQNWSLDDIDALIAGLDAPAPEKPVSPAPEQEEKEVTQEYEAKQIKEFPGEDVPVESYFDKNAKPEPVAIELPEEEKEQEAGPEEVTEPSFFYDSEMTETEIDSLVSSLFDDFMPEEKEQAEETEEDAEPSTQVYENGRPVTAPAAKQENIPLPPEKKAEPEKEEVQQQNSDEIPAVPLFEDVYSGATPGPVDTSDVPVKQAEKEEEPAEAQEEKPMGEIREFSRSKANANKLAGMVINDFVPAKKEEEKTDPDKIPDFDPLAAYMAAQKESESAGMETDENRESFLNPMKLDDTAEIDNDFLEPIDRPGIIIKKNQYEMTSDLDPLPIVISADKAKADARTKVAGVKKEPEPVEVQDEEFPGQILLSGFEPVPEESLPDNTSEAELEPMLSESRRHKAKDFIVSSEEIDGGEPEEIDGISFEKISEDVPEEAGAAPAPKKKKIKKPVKSGSGRRLYSIRNSLPEYNEPADRRHVHSALNAAGIICLRQLLIDALIGIVLLIFNMVAAFSETDLFCRGGAGYYIANAVLLIAAAVFNSRILLSGVNSFAKGAPDASGVATAVNAVIFLHLTV